MKKKHKIMESYLLIASDGVIDKESMDLVLDIAFDNVNRLYEGQDVIYFSLLSSVIRHSQIPYAESKRLIRLFIDKLKKYSKTNDIRSLYPAVKKIRESKKVYRWSM